MKQRSVQTELAAARRHQRKRRVKRGVVAGYIHQLSARHSSVRRDAALAAAPRA